MEKLTAVQAERLCDALTDEYHKLVDQRTDLLAESDVASSISADMLRIEQTIAALKAPEDRALRTRVAAACDAPRAGLPGFRIVDDLL